MAETQEGELQLTGALGLPSFPLDITQLSVFEQLFSVPASLLCLLILVQACHSDQAEKVGQFGLWDHPATVLPG